MPKLIFWLLFLLEIILSFKIGRIFIKDFHRLTEYGIGYLTGLIILFLIILCLTILLGIHIFRKVRS